VTQFGRIRAPDDELLADLRTGHDVVATVFVECHAMYRAGGPAALRPVGETEFVAGIAAMSDSGLYGPTRVAAGIVGFADLTLGDRVEPVLETHVRAGGGRFRGVRHSAAWDASEAIGNSAVATGPHLMKRPDFRAGLARLTGLGLSLDAWVFHPQLADLIDLARAFPTTTIIAGHAGGPLGYGPYAGKRASSAELAAHWRPYLETCIERFGPARCTFESNFPVEKMGIGYAALWNAFKRIAAGASAAEKLALFSGTARRAYRLEG
jgi:predicted TIM-barrel fold metal-dependent hydrolase